MKILKDNLFIFAARIGGGGGGAVAASHLQTFFMSKFFEISQQRMGNLTEWQSWQKRKK